MRVVGALSKHGRTQQASAVMKRHARSVRCFALLSNFLTQVQSFAGWGNIGQRGEIAVEGALGPLAEFAYRRGTVRNGGARTQRTR